MSRFKLKLILILIFILLIPICSVARKPDSAIFNPHKELVLRWDNDAFFSKDYYYTQGMHFLYIHPGLRKNPLNHFLFRVKKCRQLLWVGFGSGDIHTKRHSRHLVEITLPQKADFTASSRVRVGNIHDDVKLGGTLRVRKVNNQFKGHNLMNRKYIENRTLQAFVYGGASATVVEFKKGEKHSWGTISFFLRR